MSGEQWAVGSGQWAVGSWLIVGFDKNMFHPASKMLNMETVQTV